MSDPIRVFIGTEPKTEIARKVLEHSIRRNTAAEVEFTPMIGSAWEYPLTGIKVGTGFSLRRWMIPAACNWEGRAIYLDADQLVFGDIKELWEKPETQSHPRASIWCTYQPDKYSKQPWPQTSVMVIDCERAAAEWGWHLDKILAFLKKHPDDRKTYADFMHCALPIPFAALPVNMYAWWTQGKPVEIGVEWNDLNEYRYGKTKLLHYTKEPDQPWYKPTHPHAKHWKHALKLALTDGTVTESELRSAVAMFGVKQDWRNTNGLHPDYLRLLDPS